MLYKFRKIPYFDFFHYLRFVLHEKNSQTFSDFSANENSVGVGNRNFASARNRFQTPDEPPGGPGRVFKTWICVLHGLKTKIIQTFSDFSDFQNLASTRNAISDPQRIRIAPLPHPEISSLSQEHCKFEDYLCCCS